MLLNCVLLHHNVITASLPHWLKIAKQSLISYWSDVNVYRFATIVPVFLHFFSRIKLGVKNPAVKWKDRPEMNPPNRDTSKDFYTFKRLFLSWENTLSVCLCNDPVLKIKANGFFPFYPKIVRKKVRNVRVLLRSWTEPHKEKTMDAKNFQQRLEDSF